LVAERRGFTYVETDNGRKKKLDELPSIVEGFLYKATNKRLAIAESALINEVIKESNKLFMYVVKNVNVLQPSSEITPYLAKGWKPLTDKWLSAKAPVKTFWYGYESGRTNEHLKDYLANLIPSNVFGMPKITTAKNLRARGFQRVTFNIDPYPFRGADLRENMDLEQYNKLFAPRRDGISNEDDRPLISPVIKYMMENHLRKVINKVLKETIRTGEEVRFNAF
jgi:hypothetical protein